MEAKKMNSAHYEEKQFGNRKNKKKEGCKNGKNIKRKKKENRER